MGLQNYGKLEYHFIKTMFRYAENDSLELTRLLVERKEIMMALTGE